MFFWKTFTCVPSQENNVEDSKKKEKKHFETVSEAAQRRESEIEPASRIKSHKRWLILGDIANYESHFHNLTPKADHPFPIVSA